MVKSESMELWLMICRREKRRLKEIWSQMQIKKNELSWLRQLEAGGQEQSKRR